MNRSQRLENARALQRYLEANWKPGGEPMPPDMHRTLLKSILNEIEQLGQEIPDTPEAAP